MRKIKFTITFIIIFTLIFSVLPISSINASAATDPEIKANAVLLVEANTGRVLYSKNQTAKIYPASTTKIMTILLAVEAIEEGSVTLEDVVTVSENAFFDLTPDGSTSNIVAGEELTLKDLLYCAMLSSANEACNIIAEHVSGDAATYVAQMNLRAAQLGCKGTQFQNTHGLPDDEHYTTAYDLYLITEAAMNYPLFAQLCSTVKYTVPATNMSDSRELKTTNRLMQKDTSYYYEYASGVKTGYTSAAGYCLVSTASRSGIELISVVMGAESVQIEDGTTQMQSQSETKRLFTWAFASYSYKTIIDTTNLITEIPVSMGDGADSVVLRPQTEITALVDNELPIEDIEREITLNVESLVAPVMAGEVLGEMKLSYNGVNYGTVKLVANSSIEISKMTYVKTQIKAVLNSFWVKFALVVLGVFLLLYVAFVITYNIRRKKRRDAAKQARAQQVAALNRQPTTGKSFEDIEEMFMNSGQDREER